MAWQHGSRAPFASAATSRSASATSVPTGFSSSTGCWPPAPPADRQVGPPGVATTSPCGRSRAIISAHRRGLRHPVPPGRQTRGGEVDVGDAGDLDAGYGAEALEMLPAEGPRPGHRDAHAFRHGRPQQIFGETCIIPLGKLYP
ncbi:MAG: hypothetical protein U1E53_03960 [Dongiaceae bacterium]